MITIRKSNERGRANYGWLDAKYTFSFNTYYDPSQVGFRTLRVINEDHIAADQGFGEHGHSDMEIITYVVKGALAHKDSTGGEEVLRPHEIQRMTAGSGIRHSEFNPSKTEDLHLFQIWITPETKNLEPGYEQKHFPVEAKSGKLLLVASKGGVDGSVHINQDVKIYSTILKTGESVEHVVEKSRHVWIQMVTGNVDVNGTILESGDGAAISDETRLEISALEDSELILFDLS